MKKQTIIVVSIISFLVIIGAMIILHNKHKDSGFVTVPAKKATIVEAVEALSLIHI